MLLDDALKGLPLALGADITLPEVFMNFLSSVSVWQFDVPIDCFFPMNFHHTLVYKTLTPLLAVLLLYLAKLVVSSEETKAKAVGWRQRSCIW